MTFQICRISPVHHFSTDAMIGSNATRLPMNYNSEALAHKLAGRLARQEYEGFGDDYFVVVPFGGSPWRDVVRQASAMSDLDDMPF